MTSPRQRHDGRRRKRGFGYLAAAHIITSFNYLNMSLGNRAFACASSSATEQAPSSDFILTTGVDTTYPFKLIAILLSRFLSVISAYLAVSEKLKGIVKLSSSG